MSALQAVRIILGISLAASMLILLWRLDGQGVLLLFVDESAFWPSLVLCSALYAILLSVPFVPGMELGWMIMGAFGVPGIVVAWGSSVLGLGLGFVCARFFRGRPQLARLLARRDTLAATPAAQLGVFTRVLRQALGWQERHPYLFVAITLNLPGNLVLGGGGGIAWLSGVTAGVRFSLFLLATAAATCAVPVMLLVGLA